MKRLFTILSIALLLVNCKEEVRTDYVINGKAEGVYNGIRVYLKFPGEKGKEIPVDTAIVFNEKFTFTGSVKEPSLRLLTVNNVPGKITFMLENNNIDVVIDKDNIANSTFSGSKTNDAFILYREGLVKLKVDQQNTVSTYSQLITPELVTKKDSVFNVLMLIGERIKSYPLNFINENRDIDYSLFVIDDEIKKPKIEIDSFMVAYEKLSTRLKESDKGKELNQKLNALKEVAKKTENLGFGKVAPNFEAPAPDGTMISLNAIKSKVTIIDFWAAWCGPCRKENPNVVKVYEAYHDQGLEIIGVSLDGQSRQNDPKQAWIDAIEKDQLKWPQVSNLKYFSDPIARLYNITSIPATYILDKDGKIVAKNLRGPALEAKVKQLLEQ